MAKKTVFDRLEQMFSNSIIVRRKNNDGFIRVLDANRLQMLAKLRSNDNHEIYSNFLVRYYSTHDKKGFVAGYQISKSALYSEYEQMDSDPLISSALNITAHGCITKDEMGKTIHIDCEDEYIKLILENLYYDILSIRFNLWSWIRTMLKYGDHYLHLKIVDKVGVVAVTPISPYSIERQEYFDEEQNRVIVTFNTPGASGSYRKQESLKEYEISHFRLRTDNNFDPYGRSMLEPARREFRKLQLMEEAMLLHRILRAPQKRVFAVSTGNLPPEQIKSFIDDIAAQIKRVPFIDEETGNYNMLFNMMSMNEDFFVPKDESGNKAVDITNLEGMSYDAINDIEYTKNKVVAALGVPKNFLGYDQPYGARATLAIEDIRFAKSIEQIQQIVEHELKKIGIIHLLAQGFDEKDVMNFDIFLNPPSMAYEKEKIEILKDKIEIAEKMLNSKLFSVNSIYDIIYDMTSDKIDLIRDELMQDAYMEYRINKIKNSGSDPIKEIYKLEMDNEKDDNLNSNMTAGPGGDLGVGTDVGPSLDLGGSSGGGESLPDIGGGGSDNKGGLPGIGGGGGELPDIGGGGGKKSLI